MILLSICFRQRFPGHGAFSRPVPGRWGLPETQKSGVERFPQHRLKDSERNTIGPIAPIASAYTMHQGKSRGTGQGNQPNLWLSGTTSLLPQALPADFLFLESAFEEGKGEVCKGKGCAALVVEGLRWSDLKSVRHTLCRGRAACRPVQISRVPSAEGRRTPKSRDLGVLLGPRAKRG